MPRKSLRKVITAAQARIAARNARQSVLRKSPLSGGGLPGKLADCVSKDAAECELFLVEVTRQAVRPRPVVTVSLSGYPAAAPVKILNVEKAMEHKVFRIRRGS